MKTTRINNFIADELKKVTVHPKPAPLTASEAP
jgi:hypothetical protein